MIVGGRGVRRLLTVSLVLFLLLSTVGCTNFFTPSSDGKATSQALLEDLRSQAKDTSPSDRTKDSSSPKKESRSSAREDSAGDLSDLLGGLLGGGGSDSDGLSNLLGGLLGGGGSDSDGLSNLLGGLLGGGGSDSGGLSDLFGGLLGSGTKHEIVSPFAEGNVQGNRGLVFEAKKDGRTVYLMGTIHVAKREMYPFSADVKKAFEESYALAVEADVSSLGEQLTAMGYTLDGMYTDGRTYRDVLPEDVVQKIDEFKSRNRGSAMLIQDSFKPWYLYMTITQLRLSSSLKDFSPAYGIDMVLIQEAKKLGKPVRSLEGASAQMELLSTLPDDVYVEILRKELAQDDAAYRQETESLHEFLRTGDATALERAAVADYRGKSQALETYYQKLIMERNQTMARRIEEQLRGDGRPLFVAVGAAHVVGPEGLAEIFRKKGYTVRQL